MPFTFCLYVCKHSILILTWNIFLIILWIFFKIFYLFTFRERDRDRENIDMQETHQLVASHTPPTGDLAHNPRVCSWLESFEYPWVSTSNPLSHTNQGYKQLLTGWFSWLYFLLPLPTLEFTFMINSFYLHTFLICVVSFIVTWLLWETLVASHMCPDWGSNPKSRYVPWLITKPQPYGLQDNAPTYWATLARALSQCLLLSH